MAAVDVLDRDHAINRYYDPTTGQFLSVDPAVATTRAPYTYASDNPVDLTDPLGLNDCWVFSFACDVGHVAAGGAHLVAKHARGIEQGATVAAGAVLAGGCIAITVGACTVPLVEGAVVVGSGALVSAGVYGASGGSHTAGGYGKAAGEGAAGGLVGAACALIGGLPCAAGIGAGLTSFGVGAGTGVYDYATSTPSCDQTVAGYLNAAVIGALESTPFDPSQFGWSW